MKKTFQRAENGGERPKGVEPHNMNHFVYILQCSDSSYYIGYTTNLEQRVNEHNNGSGGHNTRIKRPVRLMYHETFGDKHRALKRELQLKKWSRAKKEALIKGDLNKLHDLSKRKHKDEH